MNTATFDTISPISDPLSNFIIYSHCCLWRGQFGKLKIKENMTTQLYIINYQIPLCIATFSRYFYVVCSIRFYASAYTTLFILRAHRGKAITIIMGGQLKCEMLLRAADSIQFCCRLYKKFVWSFAKLTSLHLGSISKCLFWYFFTRLDGCKNSSHVFRSRLFILIFVQN